MKRIGSAVALGVAAVALLPGSAAAACGAPVTSGAVTSVTCTAGLAQAVAVPDHLGAVTIWAAGGTGGLAGFSPYVGSGGSVQAVEARIGSFTLTLDVGAAGASGGAGGAGGIPSGGNGGTGTAGTGGGGGGYTRVSDGATVLMTAAGGGGEGTSGQFGAGGAGGGGNNGSFLDDGQPGGLCAVPPCIETSGGGATTTAPGTGENHGVGIAGNDGSGSNGGAGGTNSGGGGGGAGCFGGGGGGTTLNAADPGGGGGGGGSSCWDASLTSITHPEPPAGDGQVVISYALPAPAAITTGNATSFTVGTAGSFAIHATGNPAPAISLDNAGSLPAGLHFAAGSAGSATISGTPTGPADTVVLNVRAANGAGADAVQALSVTVAVKGSIQSTGGGFLSVGASPTSSSSSPPVATTPTSVGVKLGCNGAAGTTCSGQVKVTATRHRKKITVGLAKYTLAAGKIKTVKVKLNSRGRKLLKQLHKLKVKVVVGVSTTNGLKTAASKTVTIKAKKAKKKKK